MKFRSAQGTGWIRIFPPSKWLAEYRPSWLRHDAIAGATLFRSVSRQLSVGPTSAISLMIAGTVGSLAGADAARYAQIASLAACAVALLCVISWLFRLSILVRLVS